MDILFYSSLFILLILFFLSSRLLYLIDRNYEIYSEYLDIITELRDGVKCDKLSEKDLHNINAGIKIAANIIEARLSNEIVDLNKAVSEQIE